MIVYEYNLNIKTIKCRNLYTNLFLLASLIAQLVESTCNARAPGLIPGLGRSTREGIGYPLQYSWASLVAQLVKAVPAMWETWVRLFLLTKAESVG